MNKKLSIYSIGLTTVMVVILVFVLMSKIEKVDANPSSLNAYFTNATSSPDWIPRIAPTQYTGATTTLKYVLLMTPTTATSSLVVNSDGSDSIYVPVSFLASSTATTLQMRVSFSYNNVDWYSEDAVTQTTNILYNHASTTLIHSFKPSIVATTTKLFVISSIGAKYTKVSFDVIGGNGNLWYAAYTKLQK